MHIKQTSSMKDSMASLSQYFMIFPQYVTLHLTARMLSGKHKFKETNKDVRRSTKRCSVYRYQP